MSQMPPPPPGQPAPMGGTPATGASNAKTNVILAYLLWWVTGIIFLFVGQLVQRALDSPAQMVALFAQAGDLGPRRSELVAQPLHLIFQLVQLPRPPIRPTDARLRVRQLELQSFDGDLELAALREKVLDERLRRPGLLFRHSDRGQVETRGGADAPSRRAGNAL